MIGTVKGKLRKGKKRKKKEEKRGFLTSGIVSNNTDF